MNKTDFLKEQKEKYYTNYVELVASIKENRQPRVSGLNNLSKFLKDKFQIKITKQGLHLHCKKIIKIQKQNKHYYFSESEIKHIKSRIKKIPISKIM